MNWVRIALFTVAMVATPLSLEAQAQERASPPAAVQVDEPLYACFIPASGTIYRIRLPGLSQDCLAPNHVLFSWNQGGAPGPEGPAGPAGPAGVDGAAGPAGAQGAPGAAGADGAPGPQGPPGPVGPAGADGAQGPAGQSAFEFWQSLPGNQNRTIEEFYATLTGPQGPAGPAGAQGPAGPQGGDGLSAYEVWLTLPGNENRTLEEFYAAITGPQGPQGEPGIRLLAEPVQNAVGQSSSMEPKATLTATASCPAGALLVGGGGEAVANHPDDIQQVSMARSYPSSATTWTAVGLANSRINQGMTVRAYAICTQAM